MTLIPQETGMQIRKSLSLVMFVLLIVSGSASAQDSDVRNGGSARQRGYISAVAGTTFATETSPTVAVEYAENLGRYVQGYATFSYFDNLVNDATLDELRSVGTMLTSLTGSSWNFDARDRGIAFVAGGKFLVPTGTGIRPYVGGGAGAIKVTRTITERVRGDLTSAVIGEGLTDPTFSTADSSATKPMVEGIVGVGIAAGPTHVDVGYRYRKAFHFATPLDFGQFSVGIGYRF
jgi:opacity protein-like surface antigen